MRFSAIWIKACSHRSTVQTIFCKPRALLAVCLLTLCAVAMLLQIGMVPSLPWGAAAGSMPFDEDAGKLAWRGRMPWLSAEVATWKDDRVACITLTFDDGSWSAITGVEELLLHNRIHATYYVITSALHIKPPEYTDELRKLLSHGHEIGSHTHNHRALWDRSLNRPIGDIHEQVEHSITTLRNTFGRELGVSLTFSYPFGHGAMYDGIRTYLRRNGFIAARSTQQGMNSARGNEDDLMRIKAFPLTSYTPAKSLKWYIERVVKNGKAGLDLTWCVFFGHGARLAPHTNDDQAGYEPMRGEDMKELILTISGHVKSGHVWSATMRDAATYIRNRDDSSITSVPVTLEAFGEAAQEFCRLLYSYAGERRRSLTEFAGSSMPAECLEHMKRRTQMGNLVVFDVATRFNGPDIVVPTGEAGGGAAMPTTMRPPPPQEQGRSGEITVCSVVYLDALEDDTSFLHSTLVEDIRTRSWFCEAVLNGVAFSRSCSCRLQLDDTGSKHHEDGMPHVYHHRHRHGELENTKVRCCFNHRSVHAGELAIRARVFLSSHSGHIN
eukprot:scpid43907/ scgid28566/ 